MEIDEEILYWKTTSNKDWETVENFAKRNEDLHWGLFIVHLSVEKALKSMVASATKKSPPYTHNLRRLAELSGLKFDKDQLLALEYANLFNLEGRYPEEKMEFYKLASPAYFKTWMERLGALRLWILAQI